MAGLNDLLADGGKLSMPSLGSAVDGSTNKGLMADACRMLSGSWRLAILGFVVYEFLIASVSVFAVSANCFVYTTGAAEGNPGSITFYVMLVVSLIALLLVAGPFIVGWFGLFLSIAKDGRPNLECLFVGFRRFFKSVGVFFLYSLFILLWSLLLVVPGVIATFRYAMAFFIMADDDDCGPLEAISRSKEMMKGNKWKYFCLHWRFFGWALLCVPTGGIGYLWLIPYMQTSFAKFYEDVS